MRRASTRDETRVDVIEEDPGRELPFLGYFIEYAEDCLARAVQRSGGAALAGPGARRPVLAAPVAPAPRLHDERTDPARATAVRAHPWPLDSAFDAAPGPAGERLAWKGSRSLG